MDYGYLEVYTLQSPPLTLQWTPFFANAPACTCPWLTVPMGGACSGAALCMATISSGVYLYLLCCDLTYGPPSLQRCTCSGVNLSVCHSPFRDVPAAAWTYPWPQMLWDVPALVWTSPQSQTLRGVPVPSWTDPQLAVSLTQAHGGVPVCPVQQQRTSSNALAIASPGAWP